MLTILTSTIANGTIRNDARRNILNDNGRRFLATNNIQHSTSELVCLRYEGNDYTRYHKATHLGDGILHDATTISDALATDQPGVALVLPMADCIGAVLHDPAKNVLMLSHLGRHNLEQQGGTKSVEYMVEQFGCEPKNITAWLSPAAGQENYPLFSFGNRSMHDVATEQLLAAGIVSENITRSPIDTTTDTNYFSHSEFLKGNREVDGRFAVVASMR